ncbi:hypothetical protein NX784_02130 [Massilia pinisoli]|uniref:Uncharacterized protein n=1 Tax=Massilia pinisoli TaxID=1772194 RepID=A0ABT1ZKD4_9BURK|nr:hypothetical protein [Massilia pinisoli]MCS0580383.1 hypothetical protein [Massilia pinisoli]
MSAQERYSRARERIEVGQYEAALADLIWFHDNALLESRAWSGVRLSYALDDWVRLGELYPPAMVALHGVRDDKVAGLLDGRLDRSAFHDVAAINAILQTPEKTHGLYRQLMDAQPELARSCVQSALPSIVAAKDYRLAAQLLPDPESAVRRYAARLNYDVQYIKRCRYTRAPRRWAYLCHYLEGVQRLLAVLRGVDNHGEADRLKALAIALVPDPSLRREVRNGFVKMPRAPMMKR